MTNTERGPVRELAPRTNGRAVPCFVQHDNAGGWCERPAVVRVFENFTLCALHFLRYQLAQQEDDASLSLILLKGWRSHAETHVGLVPLITELNEIMDRQEDRYQDARDAIRILDRALGDERDPIRLRAALMEKGSDQPEG